jgi:uncharacterized protein YbgA (DUF1722 family)/uncharacterized protein YbbK (DUF523 family)
MNDKIKIGVSSCLLGEKVRWNGDHKQDLYVRNVLGKFFEYAAVCPEMEVGMGVPRETVALYGNLEDPRMISKKKRIDWTQKMNLFSKDRILQLAKEDLSGFIFKSKSPSCGLGRVPVHSEEEPGKARHGNGMFASSFMKAFPLIPVEDEGRLHDSKIKENFIIRVFSFFRLKNALLSKNAKPGTLVKFHTQHKFLILAHSRKHYQILGKIVAEVKKNPWNKVLASYIYSFMEAFSYKSTNKKNTDVLLHMMGFFKKLIPSEDRKDILDAIEDYRNELVPLVVPVTLIRHYVKKYEVNYLQDQVYLNPHPKELMLRNHV